MASRSLSRWRIDQPANGGRGVPLAREIVGEGHHGEVIALLDLLMPGTIVERFVLNQ